MRRQLLTVLKTTRRTEMLQDVAVAGALGCVGDVGLQLAERHWSGNHPVRVSEIDFRRVSALTLFSSVYIGGFLHVLYKAYPLVVAAVAKQLPSRHQSLQATLLRKQTLVHSLGCGVVDNIHCGAIYIPSYFVAVGVMQGDGFEASVQNLRTEWLVSYTSCTGFWIPCMTANFLLVPPFRRVQAMAAANLVWSVFIDYVAHRGAQHAESM